MPEAVALGPEMDCRGFSRCSDLGLRIVVRYFVQVTGQGRGVVFGWVTVTEWRKAAGA
jgi:hypothetical protein